jgi:hypothetical protein
MARFPGFDRVYEFSDPLERRPLRVQYNAELVEESQLWGRGEALPTEPVQFRPAEDVSGRQLRDVIWTTGFFPVLVRERLIHLFVSEGFTGWDTYDVELVDHAGCPVDGYHGLVISGRCGPIDYSESEIVYELLPAGPSPSYKGYRFDPASWDGSDFFMPPETEHRLVTAPVAIALRRANVRNVALERITDVLTWRTIVDDY